MRSDARGQHHVPQMLQEAFARPGKGKKSQVHVFDKQSGRAFQTSPENLLKARDFNTFEQDGTTLCLEDGIGEIEDKAAPVLRRVIAARSLAGLGVAERAILATFAALQRLRGVSMRADMLDVDRQIRDRLRRDGHDPDVIPQLDGGDDPLQVKLTALRLISGQLDAFAQAFAAKIMLLVAAAPGETFLLGDTPVTLANHNEADLQGNLGLEVEGIEIYLPIAPDLTLAFWCPSLVGVLDGVDGPRDGIAMCQGWVVRRST